MSTATFKRTRFMILAVAVPAALAVVAVALQLSWLGELPDPAATHFSFSGADGFGPAWTYPVMTAATTALMIALTVVTGVRPGAATRVMAAMMPAVVIALSIGLTWTVAAQRGLSDATTAPDPGLALLIGALIGAGYGLAAWFLVPNYATELSSADPVALPIASGERVAFMQTVRLGRGIALLLVGVVGMVLSIAILVTLQTPVASILTWVLFALMVALTVMMLAFRVRIGSDGLTVRSILGWPAWHIPLADIAEVRTVQVDPLSDFGGWGLRWHPTSGTGIVVRKGEGLYVQRRNGKKLTITVDDAQRAAETLLGLVEREASATAP